MKKLVLISLVLIFTASGVFAAKTTFQPPIVPVTLDSSNAPDAYGYTWVDNDNGGSPVYSWVDISGIGTQVQGLMDDNAVGPFDIGFDFPFYWYSVDEFYIGSNGYISFSSDANYSQDFPMIPNTVQPNDLVVPLACDIDFTAPYGTNQCYYYTNNTDTLVVSWLGVLEWNSPYVPGATHTFQLILCATDSSITFQYGEQGGNFQNPDGASQIGIEDLVGRTGLRYMYNLAPPDRSPHDGLVIRIHADPDPNFTFHDVGIAGGMNESSGGIFHAQDEPLTLRALVRNFGTSPEDNISVNCRVINSLYAQLYNENISVAHLDAGEAAWAEFPIQFTPTNIDNFTLVFRTTLTGDQFFFNNSDTTEMRSYVLPMALGYCDTAYEYTSWQGGGGGFANEFVAPEPIAVTSIDYNIQASGANPCHFFLMPADVNGNPDVNNILWSDTMYVNNPGSWINMPLGQQFTFNTGDKFFATMLAGGDSIYMGMDTSWPLSNRGWENTGSYAPSRDRSTRDIAIRIICDSYTGIEDNETSLPVSFALNQNYPNPFNAGTEISFDLNASSNVTLDVYNLAGQKITSLLNGHFETGHHNVTWDGTANGKSVTSGVYFYRLEVGDNSTTKKMVLLK